MKRSLGFVFAIALLCGIAAAQEAQAPTHILLSPQDLKWGDPPPAFEKGAQFTVVSGDPAKAGPFVVRAKFPAGFKVKPHWHPTDEHVTVLSGTMQFGMGDAFDESKMTKVVTGGYALMPSNMHHYAMALTDATVQLHGTGPFALTYANPADDPRQRTATK